MEMNLLRMMYLLITTVMFGLIPLYFGFTSRSSKVTIVAAILLMVVSIGSIGNFSLSNYRWGPTVLSLVGIGLLMRLLKGDDSLRSLTNKNKLIICIGIVFVFMLFNSVKELMNLRANGIEVSPFGMAFLIGVIICTFLWISCICMGVYLFFENRENGSPSNNQMRFRVIMVGIVSFALMVIFSLMLATDLMVSNESIREIVIREVVREINLENFWPIGEGR